MRNAELFPSTKPKGNLKMANLKGSDDTNNPSVSRQRPDWEGEPRSIESYINRGQPAPQPSYQRSIEGAMNREIARRNGRNG
jgi:hypothetical protein